MRILIVNYRYFVSGGPERYMFSVKKLLEQNGHEVIPFSVNYSNNINTEWARYFISPIAGDNEVYFKQHSWNLRSVVKAVGRAFYSKEAYKAIRVLLHDSRPDVALVLCYLKKISPSILVALREAGIPIVVRLSSYDMICPESHLLRDGKICELCIKCGIWQSIRYRCVQDSLSASIVNALATLYHRHKNYFSLIDAFITPSKFMKEKMIEAGISENKLHHIPTLTDLDQFKPNSDGKKQIISYIGRIHPTKGVETLIDAFKIIQRNNQFEKIQLKIAGDCTTTYAQKLKHYIDQDNINNVEFTGILSQKEVAHLFSSSLMSIIPSLWYENMPNAALESMACGTPVLASNIGSFPEILGEGEAGLLFESGDSKELAGKIIELLSDPQRLSIMSKYARHKSEQFYNSDLHYQRLLNLFETVTQ